MKALIIGATGATGKDLVQQLLEDRNFTEVHIFVRRAVPLQHEKLVLHVVDFEQPQKWAHLVSGEVAFSCMGTTLRAAGSKVAQWRVDHNYQYEFAKAASINRVKVYVLVSSAGADPASRFFYLRMKGQLEQDVASLDFQSVIILQPGPLERPDSDRFGERMSIGVIRFFNKLGLLRNQKPVPTAVLSQAMINCVKSLGQGIFRLNTANIFRQAHEIKKSGK